MSLLVKNVRSPFRPVRKGATVWLDTHELQAKLLSILEDYRWNSWNAYHASHDCIICHSFRLGQPAATHARNSSDRQKVERPMLTGWGILPAASHIRHVRVETAHVTAAAGARSSRGGDGSSPSGRDTSNTPPFPESIIIFFDAPKPVQSNVEAPLLFTYRMGRQSVGKCWGRNRGRDLPHVVGCCKFGLQRGASSRIASGLQITS